MKNKSMIYSAVLAVLLLSLLFSCKKETPATRYQVVNNCTYFVAGDDPDVNGTFWSAIVYVYKGNDVISQQNLGNIAPEGGKSAITEVNSGATSVRLSFLKARLNVYLNVRYYAVTPVDLTAGQLTTVTMTDDTPVSTILPTQ